MSERILLSETFQTIRENLHFVLVEPQSPGNIGSVARALKTSGFEKLILVNPCPLDQPELRMLAHRSLDIVENAHIVSTFEEAVSDKKLVIGTTMRSRSFKFPLFSPEEICEKILSAANQPLAIVFGTEKNGLSNEQLLQCHLHSSVPTATQNPSLNLAQAVLVYAHTFFQKLNSSAIVYTYEPASQRELETFYEHLSAALEMIRFIPRDGIENFITRFRRFIGRAMAERRDVRLLHKLIQVFETRIRDLEKDSSTPPRDIF